MLDSEHTQTLWEVNHAASSCHSKPLMSNKRRPTLSVARRSPALIRFDEVLNTAEGGETVRASGPHKETSGCSSSPV